jgi:hypothetical protein
MQAPAFIVIKDNILSGFFYRLLLSGNIVLYLLARIVFAWFSPPVSLVNALSYLCILMKKLCTFLLLLITFSASFFPCCDKDDCCNDKFSAGASSHRENKSNGNCSPFITCGSCPGFTALTKMIEVPVVHQEKIVHHSGNISFELFTYTVSLLRPPRFA